MSDDPMRLWSRCWAGLTAARDDGAHPWRNPTLATTGLGGGGEARIVVLRSVDREAATIAVQSDLATPKVAEVRANPLATFLFWDPVEQLQARLRVEIEVIEGDALDATWAAMPAVARLNYGNRPPPGAPIRSPDDHERCADRARFAVLSGRVTSLDVVDISLDPHLRAIFRREDGFAGGWLAP